MDVPQSNMLDESLLANLRQSFASAVQRINLPSLGGTFTFRESTVAEHKAFSKTVISNMDSQSVVYAATLAMIGNLCIDRGFDPKKMSEFDRLRTIVHLFSNNFFSKKLSLRCPKKSCGETVRYAMKYGSLLEMMDSVDCSDMVFDVNGPAGKACVTAGFPSAGRYLSILEAIDAANIADAAAKRIDRSSYEAMDAAFSEIDSGGSAEDDAVRKIRKRREVLKGKIAKTVEKKEDVLGNVDIRPAGRPGALLDLSDIYLKRIQISSIPGSDSEFDIDLSGFGYDDTEKVLSALPMGLFTDERGNVVKRLSDELFHRMNACVPKITCPKCGCDISSRLTLQSFFVFG